MPVLYMNTFFVLNWVIFIHCDVGNMIALLIKNNNRAALEQNYFKKT